MTGDVIDLARRRVVQAGWKALADAIARCDPGRVAAYLEELEADEMAHAEPHRAIRIPVPLIERAAKLVPHVKERTQFGQVARVSVAAVIRLALVRGLEALELEKVDPET